MLEAIYNSNRCHFPRKKSSFNLNYGKATKGQTVDTVETATKKKSAYLYALANYIAMRNALRFSFIQTSKNAKELYAKFARRRWIFKLAFITNGNAINQLNAFSFHWQYAL